MTPSIVKLDHRQQTKFVCSACGSGRDCDCNAPALERLAEIKEQARQRQIKKREQEQQPRHVTGEGPRPGDDEYERDKAECIALNNNVKKSLLEVTEVICGYLNHIFSLSEDDEEIRKSAMNADKAFNTLHTLLEKKFNRQHQ
jgi:hypothetical protein